MLTPTGAGPGRALLRHPSTVGVKTARGPGPLLTIDELRDVIALPEHQRTLTSGDTARLDLHQVLSDLPPPGQRSQPALHRPGADIDDA